MNLKKMVVKNFKGLKKLDIDFEQQTTIKGDNATGKTSIYDAFLWCLFDKDSQNKSQFSVKPIDATNPQVEVTLLLEIEEKEVLIKKILKEKWTKKRGQATKEFCGHTTEYYIDEVPQKKKEFTEYINSVIQEDTFKLITNVKYFNEVLHWEKRRDVLFDVSGTVQNEQIAEKHPEYKDLIKELTDKSIDAMKKMLQSKKRDINSSLEEIPVRIDELNNFEIDMKMIELAEEENKELEKKLNEKQAQLKKDSAEDQINKLKMDISVKNAEATKTEAEIEKKYRKKTLELQDMQDSHLRNIRDYESKIEDFDRSNERIKLANQENQKQIEDARNEYLKVFETKFEYSQDSVCPTCNQAIPEEQLKKARNKAFDDFKARKDKKLSEIKARGEDLKKKFIDDKSGDLITQLKKGLPDLKNKLKNVSEEIEKIKNDKNKELEESKARFELEVSKIKENLEKAKNTNSSELTEEIESIKEDIKKNQQTIAKKEIDKQNKARIEELKKQERKLAKEFEKLEKELNLCDEFIKIKVDMMQTKINVNFKLAKFKLFDIQVNGGVNSCCEVMFDNVPYNDLNNAMKINIGLDIINTLSKHYNLSAPIFIDNAESVTEFEKTEAQLIKLVVSEEHKKLTVCK